MAIQLNLIVTENPYFQQLRSASLNRWPQARPKLDIFVLLHCCPSDVCMVGIL